MLTIVASYFQSLIPGFCIVTNRRTNCNSKVSINIVRGKPLEITGGRVKIFQWMIFLFFFFFFSANCLHEFFFFDVKLKFCTSFVFSTALLLSYFGSVYLQEFFLKGELLAGIFYFLFLLLLLLFFFFAIFVCRYFFLLGGGGDCHPPLQ